MLRTLVPEEKVEEEQRSPHSQADKILENRRHCIFSEKIYDHSISVSIEQKYVYYGKK